MNVARLPAPTARKLAVVLLVHPSARFKYDFSSFLCSRGSAWGVLRSVWTGRTTKGAGELPRIILQQPQKRFGGAERARNMLRDGMPEISPVAGRDIKRWPHIYVSKCVTQYSF